SSKNTMVIACPRLRASLIFLSLVKPGPKLSASAPLNQLSMDMLRTRGRDWPANSPVEAMHGYLLSPGHRQIPGLFAAYCHSGLFFRSFTSQWLGFEPSLFGFPVQVISPTGFQSPADTHAEGTLSELSST